MEDFQNQRRSTVEGSSFGLTKRPNNALNVMWKRKRSKRWFLRYGRPSSTIWFARTPRHLLGLAVIPLNTNPPFPKFRIHLWFHTVGEEGNHFLVHAKHKMQTETEITRKLGFPFKVFVLHFVKGVFAW